MKEWPWLITAINSILKEAATLGKESNLADIVDMSVQMECIELNIMTSGMEIPTGLTKEARRIRKLRDEMI